MREEQVFVRGGILHRVAVESFSFVPNRDGDFSIHIATAGDVHSLAGVITVAMDHGIREGFKQGHLDVDFTSIRHSKVQNEPHELIDEWGDDSDSAWERLAQLNENPGLWIRLHPNVKSLILGDVLEG